MQITICGGGNSAHTSAGLLASQGVHQVKVYISFADEAKKWQEGIRTQGGIRVQRDDDAILGRPNLVSSDPGEVIPGSQLVLLALPAFAHESVLGEINPYLEKGALVGAFAARGSFDLGARDVLQSKSSVTLFGFQTLPWACRITDFGKSVKIMGTKKLVDFATCPPHHSHELCSFLSKQLEINLEPIGSFLSLTLAGTGQIIHPGVMFGLFHDWDGDIYKEAPLFYQGIDSYTEGILQSLSDEIQSIRRELTVRYPEIDLSPVRPLDEWLCRSYADEIEDTSSLQTYFVTNRSYDGLKVPMVESNNGLAPDFNARYLSEDVPYALIATRGIAGFCGIQTPIMDKVIEWAQVKLGKEYLVGGTLAGKDIKNSRAPQRYGFKELDEMIDAMFCPT